MNRERNRILLVDDEPLVLGLFSRILNDAGYDVVTAQDGLKAMELFETADFDLIISDISMPRMNGIDMLRSVRERDLDIPVILVTANPAYESAAEAVRYGALRYLSKPIEARLLTDTAARAIQLHQIARLKREALAYMGQGAKQIGDLAGLEATFARAMRSMWIVYQPIISWAGQSVFGYEALVRTGELALPYPVALLEAAERLTRLNDLGRAIRGLVAGKLATISGDETLFVNLHPRDLLDDTLSSPESALSGYARQIVLEITEREALDDIKDVRRRVAALRALGYRLALDDLGAGYAGLSSFAHLEPDIVKIDISLVHNVHQEPTKQKLIRSLARLCAELGILVIAEGIESREERDVIVDLGVDLLQGFFFARPERELPMVIW